VAKYTNQPRESYTPYGPWYSQPITSPNPKITINHIVHSQSLLTWPNLEPPVQPSPSCSFSLFDSFSSVSHLPSPLVHHIIFSRVPPPLALPPPSWPRNHEGDIEHLPMRSSRRHVKLNWYDGNQGGASNPNRFGQVAAVRVAWARNAS
jgi:hypothetical protein